MENSTLIDQMKAARGNARHWLDWVEAGQRPHFDGVDNTIAFVAHYEKMFAEADNYLRAHA